MQDTLCEQNKQELPSRGTAWAVHGQLILSLLNTAEKDASHVYMSNAYCLDSTMKISPKVKCFWNRTWHSFPHFPVTSQVIS